MSEISHTPNPVNIYLTRSIADTYAQFPLPYAADTAAIDRVAWALAPRRLSSKNLVRVGSPVSISSQGLDLILGASTRECVDIMTDYIQEGTELPTFYQAIGNMLKPTTLATMYRRPVPKIGIRPDDRGAVTGRMLAADLLGLDPHTLENSGIANNHPRGDMMAEVCNHEKRELLERVAKRLPLAILKHQDYPLY